jgi:hypothetical protein
MLVIATAVLVVLATYFGIGRPQTPPVPADLSDPIRLDSQEQKRSLLIEGARRQLKYITEKFDNIFNTLLVRANCEVVESRLEQEYENADAAPMMITSSLLSSADEKQCFFFVWCFNPHREDDAILLVGETPDGTTVRVRYESNLTEKRIMLVGTFAGRTRLVSLDELCQAGKVSRSDGQIEVCISTDTTDALVVPDLPMLAVALHDRNGKLSNFVSVERLKEVSWANGFIQPEGPEKGTSKAPVKTGKE